MVVLTMPLLSCTSNLSFLSKIYFPFFLSSWCIFNMKSQCFLWAMWFCWFLFSSRKAVLCRAPSFPRNHRQYHPLSNPTTKKNQNTAPGDWKERGQDDQAGEKLPRKSSLVVNLDSSLIPLSTWGRANIQIFHETRL